MTNEIHPFEISISITKGLSLGLLKLGVQNELYIYIYSKSTEKVKFKVIEILTSAQCLCRTTNNGTYAVLDNLDASISRQVILYDEVKHLKFVEQTKLFEDEQ